MLNPNRVLSKAQILDHVWDYDFRGESGIVESYISYLRRKIDTEGLPAADPHQARCRLRPAPASPGLMGLGSHTAHRRRARCPRRAPSSRRFRCGPASWRSWAPSSARPSSSPASVTALLMRSDLMDRVDAELLSVARPVANQALADLEPATPRSRRSYAFELQTPVR